jgi:magnesium transporter
LPDSSETIKGWLFQPDREPSRFSLDNLAKIVAEDRDFAWLDLSGYNKVTLQNIATTLKLHPIGVQAALSAWQRPRLDNFGDHFFITGTVAQPRIQQQQVQAAQLDLFVGSNFLFAKHPQVASTFCPAYPGTGLARSPTGAPRCCIYTLHHPRPVAGTLR